MTGISTLNSALLQIDRIQTQQTQIDQLSFQLTTGKKTNRFSGLGSDILRSQRARSSLQSLETYRSNITIANSRMSLMMGAIEEFESYGRDIHSMMQGLSKNGVHQRGEDVTYDDPLTEEIETTKVGRTSGDPSENLYALQNLAESVYNVMIDLLNTKDGDRYLFSGADTSKKPITEDGFLQTVLEAKFENWKSGSLSGADFLADLQNGATANNGDAVTDSTIGYSAELSSGNVGDIFVRVDDNKDVNYTTLANDPAFRDILVTVAYIKDANLGPITDVYEPPNAPPNAPDIEGAPGDTVAEQITNFYAMFDSMTSFMGEALGKLTSVKYNIGNAQTQLQKANQRLDDQGTLLQNIVAEVEDADENEVALKLQKVLGQIENSYAVSARLQQLSLVNFI